MIVFCFIQAVIAIMLLLIELKKHKSLVSVRCQIFIVTSILQLNTALHFTFYSDEIKIYSYFLMESVRFYVLFLVCYYFTKKAIGLLTVT
jgi:hypothetical protein